MSRAVAPSPRTKVRRRAGRGKYGRSAIDAILDEGLVGHVSFVVDGQPYGIPMLYARDGDVLYMHGSPLSRLLAGLAEGVPACFTVTLVDGLVLARSAFHHSVNYRSVVALGQARAIADPDAKFDALTKIVEHVAASRSADARGPSPKELKATEVVSFALDEASAKVRKGGPVDAPEDYALPIWAGELPLGMSIGKPITDDRCSEPIPDYVHHYQRPHA